MEEISVKGKNYVKAKLVARELGYTTDYIGQLCRAGKVDAQLVGRTWYVDPESVQGHKKTRYRSTKASTKRELKSDVLRALQEEESGQKEHFYERKAKTVEPDIRYEEDAADLMPVTIRNAEKTQTEKPKAVELEVELADAKKVDVENETDKQYHFEAPKREETKFFGTLRVTDFITEVQVAGEEDETQSVPVKGAERHIIKKKPHTETKIKSPELRRSHVKLHQHTVDVIPQKHVHNATKSTAVPVMVDEEETTLPITYHIITATAFFASLVIAAAIVGFEATITASADSVETIYAFVVSNLSALIFFVK